MARDARKSTTIEVDGRELRISNPDKVWFPADPASGRTESVTKLDCVDYFLAVGPGIRDAVLDRPVVLHRFPDGADSEGFYQKRVPKHAPDWIRTVRIRFPSGRAADELCPTDLAHVIWAVNLGGFELHPWPVTAADVDHPDLVRVDLDPQAGIGFDPVRRVAAVVREVLTENALTGFPKTSGGRGLHVLVPIEARWTFLEVRRAVLALAREVERRIPDLATSKWWKEERGRRVFVDYNQSARDRTIVATYAVRPTPTGTVSTPVHWEEIPHVDPADFTLTTVPARYAELGDLHAGIRTGERGRLDALLALSDRDEEQGLGDAPWPPNFPKRDSEPPRVQPSMSRGVRAALRAAGIDPAAEPPAQRQAAVVFDLDGVLASNAWRSHLVETSPKDWDGFFAGIPRDPESPAGRRMFDTVRSGVERLIVTGRPERTRAATTAWLQARHYPDVPLLMRADDDHRPDQMVKRDLYETVIEPRWDVQMAIEDRWQSAAMWQSYRIRTVILEDPGLTPQA
ncbi:MAG: non-homologous end-joining DNA ligase [Acidimicrobiia bacterium]|nr:non-homologous end-joining DNA ligase [Acidimicrobiia bacterium]